jgi:hypothetical protein
MWTKGSPRPRKAASPPSRDARRRPTRSPALAVAGLLTALLLNAAPAHADAIDGNWCNPEAGYMEIRGADILTPGGTRMAGDYSRHAFRYIAPAGETRAGATLDMVLVDDDTIHLVNTTAPDGIEVWRRCSAPVS